MCQDPGRLEELEREVSKLERINAALMERVEQGLDKHADGFSLFQAATLLEDKVRERTGALETALGHLERSNRALQVAKEEAEKAAQSKDQFLASMSHELRTPLNAILGLSEILLEEIGGPLSERQRGHLEHVSESGRHLLSLINDVLDVAKAGAGEMRMHLGPVRIADACEASLGFVATQAAKKTLSLSAHLPSDEEVFECDERRLKQILINLLSNAVKFTPEGGAISLEVGLDPDAEVVSFSVTDTGIGIDKEKQAGLFQPFAQLDSGLSRQYDGTGLGLSLVSHMTQALGGLVTLESESGAGSRFTVILPWVRLLASAATSTSLRPASLNRTTTDARPVVNTSPPQAEILLAEDNTTNVEMMVSFLEPRGYRVILAGDGAEAVRLARERSPDLILMDVQMPRVDGLEATRQIRADPATHHIPVIALTALALPGDEERCLDAGADRFLTKPVHLAGLATIIDRELAKRRRGARLRPCKPNSDQAILVVEDNEINQEVVLEMLEILGYRADLVNNGVEAVESFDPARHFLVLMDLQMPEMDGYEATALIRSQNDAGRTVPIVALTANAQDTDRARCLAAGMNDHVSKPIDMARLRDVIEEWAPAKTELV